MKPKPLFKYNEYLEIIDYFKSNDNNRTSVIANKLNYSLNNVSYYIDVYLSLKRNYMGGSIDMPSSRFNYTNKIINQNGIKNKSAIELYENNEFIGSFNSISDAANFLDIRTDYIYIKMAKEKLPIFTINHSFIKRKITYKLIKN